MNKLKLGVIFGGMSTEHDVSITSGTSVIKINTKYIQYILIKMENGLNIRKKLMK
jgi:D-alanine-D-alanine ligase-like ATP-grasp enzyme